MELRYVPYYQCCSARGKCVQVISLATWWLARKYSYRIYRGSKLQNTVAARTIEPRTTGRTLGLPLLVKHVVFSLFICPRGRLKVSLLRGKFPPYLEGNSGRLKLA